MASSSGDTDQVGKYPGSTSVGWRGWGPRTGRYWVKMEATTLGSGTLESRVRTDVGDGIFQGESKGKRWKDKG